MPLKASHCPEGKVLNPETGRCVKVTGVIGKKIMMRSSSPAPVAMAPNILDHETMIDYSVFEMQGYHFNPKTYGLSRR